MKTTTFRTATTPTSAGITEQVFSGAAQVGRIALAVLRRLIPLRMPWDCRDSDEPYGRKMKPHDPDRPGQRRPDDAADGGADDIGASDHAMLDRLRRAIGAIPKGAAERSRSAVRRRLARPRESPPEDTDEEGR